MSVTDIKRPNYYEGQYLGARDLLAAQEYQRQQDQRHRLAAHTWGVAAGLELEERARPGGSPDAVDVYVKPGYAVDGFGRTIVVLEPYKIREALFAQFTFEPALPEGRWLPVWLQYREQKTDPPRPGFAVCDVEEQAFRILETFRIIAGEMPVIAQRKPISVAGQSKDAADEVPDGSVPYQSLPESGDAASRWLIPLGFVRWLAPNPPSTTAGHFVKSVTDDDLRKVREGRGWIGVIAESVLAPAGKLRIRDRKNPKPLIPETPELLGVEGSLRVDGSSHFRDLLITDSFVNIDSQNRNSGNPAPGNPLGGPALTFGLFSFEGIASQRTGVGNLNGLDFYTKNEAHLSITNGGNVGIGTKTPVTKLEVVGNWTGEEGALCISGDKPTVRFTGGAPANNESWVAHLGSRGPGNLEFFHRTGPAAWDQVFSLTPSGRVGIGTSNPTKKLEVLGDLQVTGGNIFVGSTMVPVHTPVDVVTGERFLNAKGDQTGSDSAQGIDFFLVSSRLSQVKSANLIVALSDVSNEDVATWARWRVHPITSSQISPNTFRFGVQWQVDDSDGHLLAYSFVAVFVP